MKRILFSFVLALLGSTTFAQVVPPTFSDLSPAQQADVETVWRSYKLARQTVPGFTSTNVVSVTNEVSGTVTTTTNVVNPDLSKNQFYKAAVDIATTNAPIQNKIILRCWDYIRAKETEANAAIGKQAASGVQ